MTDRMHISVCVCTYRRPELLARLLEGLAHQETHGRFTYSVVVVDNDRTASARAVVEDAVTRCPVPIVYRVETAQGIAHARNRAVQSATGDFVAFIDDDERPIATWLLLLFETCVARGADGALGPVKPSFDTEPPGWITRGRFFERADYPTGFVIAGDQGRTGNVLLRRHLFRDGEPAFRVEFVTGEDQDFFRRRIAEGRMFVWCSEAVAYETVPPARWRRSYIVRKAVMRGRYRVIEPTFGRFEAGKSVVAIVLYAAALPALFLGGQHVFMRYLEKFCYHAGAVLALTALAPRGATYVSE
jgi:succinoglycan biosynthesis protein ExoM